MSEDFAKNYTLANIPSNAALYQAEQFLDWLKRLESVKVEPNVAVAIMVRELSVQDSALVIG